MKVKRATLEIAQRFVIEIAGDVSRKIAHDETNDLVVDPAACARHRGVNALVDLGDRQTARGNRRQVDERT